MRVRGWLVLSGERKPGEIRRLRMQQIETIYDTGGGGLLAQQKSTLESSSCRNAKQVMLLLVLASRVFVFTNPVFPEGLTQHDACGHQQIENM